MNYSGPTGHIGADFGIANWPYGKYLLNHLVAETAHKRVAFAEAVQASTLTFSAPSGAGLSQCQSQRCVRSILSTDFVDNKVELYREAL